MTAISKTKKTPIMLTSHTYLNLDGFQNPQTSLALDRSLYMPYAGLRIAIDNIEVPTGDILGNQQNGVHDFWSTPKPLGANITSPDLLGACGYNCTGYDTCYPFNRDAQMVFRPYSWQKMPLATLASPWSGIQLDLYTDQHAMQVYTCNNMNGKLARKSNSVANLLNFELGTFARRKHKDFSTTLRGHESSTSTDV